MTLEELKAMFPGDWKFDTSWQNYVLSVTYGDQVYELHYKKNDCHDHFNCTSIININGTLAKSKTIMFVKLSDAKKFYKEHFRLGYFK